MDQRIRFISHEGKQILLVDFSMSSATEAEKTARTAPDFVTAQPRGSVLLLADFTGTSFNRETLLTMKESAVFNKPHIRKSAWTGAESLPATFCEDIKSFSRREITIFKTRKEALAWLVRNE